MPTITYEYKGNQFLLRKRKLPGYAQSIAIESIHALSPLVELPETYQGIPITRVTLSFQNPEVVTTLVIPKNSSLLSFGKEGRTLPNLTRLEVAPGNRRYATDGRCLLSADRSILLRCLTLGDASPLTLEESIRKIQGPAFRHTRMTSITFSNPDIKVADEAFQDSAWLEAQGDKAIIGRSLYRLRSPIDLLDLSEEVEGLHPGAFLDCLPNTILCNRLPQNKNLETDFSEAPSAGEHIPQGRFRRLLLTQDVVMKNHKALHDYPTLEEVSLKGPHPKYRTQEGILYTADGRGLLYCPPVKPLKDFQVPEGVEYIETRAFLGQHYLEKLYLPDSVTAIGPAAFTLCQNLKEVRLPENLLLLPDACGDNGEGVFEGCGKLTHVYFGQSLLSIGNRAFLGCPLQSPCLPRSLKRIGLKALPDALGETTLYEDLLLVGEDALKSLSCVQVREGTAKGLWGAIPRGGISLFIRTGRKSEDDMSSKDIRLTIPFSPQEVEKSMWLSSLMETIGDVWDENQFNIETLSYVASQLYDSLQKAKYLLSILNAFPQDSDFTDLRQELDQILLPAYQECIEDQNLDDFKYLLENYPLSEETKAKVLEEINEREEPTFAAYLLHLQRPHSNKEKKNFRL